MPGDGSAAGSDGSAARRLGDSAAGRVWGQSASGLWLQLREQAESCLSTFKQLTGMPDYNGYVRHLRLMHPSWPIPTEREFFDLYLDSRYGDGPTRCC
jgi:uncharacterized short protein YbdD (DUF466 family)